MRSFTASPAERAPAAATAAAVIMTAPLFGGAIPAKADNLQLAQRLDVEVDRDRDRDDWRGRRRDRDVTIGIGPGGVHLGRDRARCRSVTTTVERDDGRRIRRTERRCD